MTGRYAWVAAVRPERLAEYRALHERLWPEMATLLRDAGIRSYTIHLDERRHLLFARFDQSGPDFVEAMAQVDAHPVAHAWDEATRPCLIVPDGEADAWTRMTELFSLD